MLAPQAVNVVNPEVVIPAPKQVKLLGAKVQGIGTITTVSEQNVWRWALIEDTAGREHHVFLCDLTKEMLELAPEQVPYRHVTRRIGFGLIESGWEMTTVPFSDLTHVSIEELERAA